MKAADRDDRIENQVAAPLRHVHTELDEVHRARLGSAIEAALDREEQARRAPAGGPARRTRVFVWGAALAAAAAITMVVWRGTREPNPAARPAPAVAIAAPAPALTPAALLVPYSGAAAAGVAPATSLVALAGEKARATIGTRVRLTLIGPGRVSVLPAPRGGDLEVALDGGRLLVDYDGRSGGTLRVRSPGAVTTVVGTLFAVDVTPYGSRVGVAHGRVRTQDASGREWQIATGTNWSSAEARVSPLAPELAVAMREHEASWTGDVPAPRHVPHVPPAAKAQVDLDTLYAQAEAAMRDRQTGKARRILQAIAARDPAGALGEAALLDLARLALSEGDRAEARRVLQRLRTPLRDPALAETAQHLRARASEADGGDVSEYAR